MVMAQENISFVVCAELRSWLRFMMRAKPTALLVYPFLLILPSNWFVKTYIKPVPND